MSWLWYAPVMESTEAVSSICSSMQLLPAVNQIIPAGTIASSLSAHVMQRGCNVTSIFLAVVP